MKIDKKILIISIIAGIFIYNRTLDYYKVLPRKNIYVSISIVIWSYLTLKEPIFLIPGLIFLNTLNGLM
tara:strand:- start:789 stop:995 length:207 start_codon:yes stop_codon:yes gene_type:complete